MRFTRSLETVAALAVAAGFAACSGGGGTSPTPAAGASATPTPAPGATATPTTAATATPTGAATATPTGAATATPTAVATATPTAVPTATPTVAPTPTPTVAPTPTPTATAAPQVVSVGLPTLLGSVVDPTYGVVGGYTQSNYSQVLAFVPGARIMIQSVDSSVPHTFNVVATSGGFPSNPSFSFTASGGSTIGAGFASGNISYGSAALGPFTLSAGTYFIGCGYHYQSNTMRTVINVSASATPGPQATPPAPQPTDTPPGYGY